jgi:hypothetical protein
MTDKKTYRKPPKDPRTIGGGLEEEAQLAERGQKSWQL